MEKKYCTKCDTIKNVIYFSQHPHKKGTYITPCLSCRSHQERQRYKAKEPSYTFVTQESILNEMSMDEIDSIPEVHTPVISLCLHKKSQSYFFRKRTPEKKNFSVYAKERWMIYERLRKLGKI